jgi:hypothetical protein
MRRVLRSVLGALRAPAKGTLRTLRVRSLPPVPRACERNAAHPPLPPLLKVHVGDADT